MVFGPLALTPLSFLSTFFLQGLLPSPSGLLRVPGLLFLSLPFGHISATSNHILVYNTSVLYSHSMSLCTLLLHSATSRDTRITR